MRLWILAHKKPNVSTGRYHCNTQVTLKQTSSPQSPTYIYWFYCYRLFFVPYFIWYIFHFREIIKILFWISSERTLATILRDSTYWGTKSIPVCTVHKIVNIPDNLTGEPHAKFKMVLLFSFHEKSEHKASGKCYLFFDCSPTLGKKIHFKSKENLLWTSPPDHQQVSKKDQCKNGHNFQEFLKEKLQRLAGKLLHLWQINLKSYLWI